MVLNVILSVCINVTWSICHSECSLILFLLWIVRIITEWCRLICLLLQIATFFSNNLDFFTSAAYSPKGSTVVLSPLQAESMLTNKKKASAYIHAIKKVRWFNNGMFYNFAFLCKNGWSMFGHLLLNIMDLADMKFVKIVSVNVTILSPHLCLSSFLPLAQATISSIQRSPIESSYSHQLHWEQRRSHSAGMLLALNTLFRTHFSKLESICVKGMFHFSKIGHRGPAAIALLSLSYEQSNRVIITISHLCLLSRVKKHNRGGLHLFPCGLKWSEQKRCLVISRHLDRWNFDSFIAKDLNSVQL